MNATHRNYCCIACFFFCMIQGILSRLLHDRTPGVRGEAVKALALVAGVADASAVRWLLLLGEVRFCLRFCFVSFGLDSFGLVCWFGLVLG